MIKTLIVVVLVALVAAVAAHYVQTLIGEDTNPALTGGVAGAVAAVAVLALRGKKRD